MQSDHHSFEQDSENIHNEEEFEVDENDEEYEAGEEYEEGEGYEENEEFHSDRGNEAGEEEEVFQQVSRSMSRLSSHGGDHSRLDDSELPLGTKNNYEETESAMVEEPDVLPAERLVRLKIYRFINKLRKQYLKPLFYNDLYGNRLAMEYAQHILAFKENRTDISGFFDKYFFFGEYKVSTFSAFIDVSNDDGGKRGRFNDYSNEIVDAHSTLIEFDEDRDNIFSQHFNTVAVGMAFDDERVAVVDVFTHREVVIDKVTINRENQNIEVCGKMLTDKMGVFALRVVPEDHPNKALHLISPQYISYDSKSHTFIANLNCPLKVFDDESPKMIEVYLRHKPETIKYGVPTTEKTRVEDLQIGFRLPMLNYPHPRVSYEIEQEDLLDKKKQDDDIKRKKDEDNKERDERERRIAKSENYDQLGGKRGLDMIIESDSEYSHNMSGNNLTDSVNKSLKAPTKRTDTISSEQSVREPDEDDDITKKEVYEKQMAKLEEHIDELRREVDETQKKIAIIYEYRKAESKEERNYYKESNINEATYIDSLTSAANLCNELNIHKRKLDADLQKYKQSIEIQEERKRDVYKILMNYKQELLMNAEDRKGQKIKTEVVERWLNQEKDFEDEIKSLRITNIKLSLELNRLNKDLKKMEEYFEGLHLIDFEQLKIENNTLTEKIEDRNEEILKLKKKINDNVQILAHIQEKYTDINSKHKKKQEKFDDVLLDLNNNKLHHGTFKKKINKNSDDHLMEQKKLDMINSKDLKKYYVEANRGISGIYSDITNTMNELKRYRKGKDIKDILLLEKRYTSLWKEYEKIPKFKDTEEDMIA